MVNGWDANNIAVRFLNRRPITTQWWPRN